MVCLTLISFRKFDYIQLVNADDHVNAKSMQKREIFARCHRTTGMTLKHAMLIFHSSAGIYTFSYVWTILCCGSITCFCSVLFHLSILIVVPFNIRSDFYIDRK